MLIFLLSIEIESVHKKTVAKYKAFSLCLSSYFINNVILTHSNLDYGVVCVCFSTHASVRF